MIKLSDAAKEKYAKYVGPDGRLIIDETVPEKLRETFQYFNDNNINILQLNVDDTIDETEEPDASLDNDDLDIETADENVEITEDENIEFDIFN